MNSQYNQEQACPPPLPPPQSYPPQIQQGPYVVPPPAGYPMNSGAAADHKTGPGQTQNKGDDGFWEGCCAALCCCFLLDACF